MTKPLKSAKVELPLTNDSEIEELVQQFESLTLPYENWTHRAHLAVAVFYVRSLAFDVALSLIRQRINAYNIERGDPNGYNETITIMFLRKISAEAKHKDCQASMHGEVARLESICNVDWLYQYYSRSLIWSSEAKKCWVEPDVSKLDF